MFGLLFHELLRHWGVQHLNQWMGGGGAFGWMSVLRRSLLTLDQQQIKPPCPTPYWGRRQILVANEGHESVPAFRRCWNNCQPGGSHRSGLPLSPIAGGDASAPPSTTLESPPGVVLRSLISNLSLRYKIQIFACTVPASPPKLIETFKKDASR